jgi:hypothetical protein
MDASKAFGRINHFHLFDKLLQRGMPVAIVRLLYTWYATQTYVIKWCNILSQPFTVSNGVRQGGILSPVLFNVYNDELSFKLSQCKVGCHVENVCFNPIFYADDTILLSPAPSALQKLINICEVYGIYNEILYNTRKTVCMAFQPKFLKRYRLPCMRLDGNILNWVDEHKYLGYYFTSDNCDVRDMRRQLQYIYSKGNVLYRKFHKCDDPVKILLFRMYCSNLYCCQIWCNYSESKINAVKVAYNNVFRKLLGIKKPCSMSELYVRNNIDSFPVLLRKATVNFRSRLYNSSNVLINTVLHSLFFHINSKMYSTWAKRIF